MTVVWIACASLLTISLALFLKFPERIYISTLFCLASSLLLHLKPEKLFGVQNWFAQLPPAKQLRLGTLTLLLLAVIGWAGYKKLLWEPTDKLLAERSSVTEALEKLHATGNQLYVVCILNSFACVSPWSDLGELFRNFDFFKPNYLSRGPVAEAMLAKHHCKDVVSALQSTDVNVIANKEWLAMIHTLLLQHHKINVAFVRVPSQQQEFEIWHATSASPVSSELKNQ